MLKLLTSASLATALMFSAANAQSPSPAPSPSAPSGTTQVKPPLNDKPAGSAASPSRDSAASPSTTSPSRDSAASPSRDSAASPSATSPTRDTAASPSPSASGMAVKLTDAEAERWMNKTVFSSDDKNLGEVSGFMRAADGTVQELHADIGGFLGIGETRVRIMPSQFKLSEDRVVLNVTGEQAKTLPQISK